MMTKIIIDLDRNKFFDMVAQVGVESAGNRLVEMMLSSKNSLRDDIGLAMYGITVQYVKDKSNG